MSREVKLLRQPCAAWILAWACALGGGPCLAQVVPGDDPALATADPGSRVDLSVRPALPAPQHPLASTPDNIDTNKPPHLWQRASDDWMGARPWLEDRGISFNASLSLEISRRFRGGATTRDWAAGSAFDANLTVDTQKLMNVTGGTLFINFQQQTGSARAVDGAVQNASDASQEGRTQVSELWYEQKFGEVLRFKLGKIDANTEFSHVESADEFLNGALGTPSTIYGLPTHPDPAAGAALFVYPVEHLYAGVGLFDGSGVAGSRTGAHALGLSHVPNLFWIGEAGGTWSLTGGREGRAGVGLWHVSGDVPRFDGGHDSGATGPYAFLEQTLWRASADEADDDRGIAAFLQFGQAGAAYSHAKTQFAGGLAWTGPLPGRDLDVAGLGVTWAALGKDPAFVHRDEWAIEAFYRLRLTQFISLKPDLQYIHHPAEAARDCVVGTVQIVIDF